MTKKDNVTIDEKDYKGLLASNTPILPHMEWKYPHLIFLTKKLCFRFISASLEGVQMIILFSQITQLTLWAFATIYHYSIHFALSTK